MNYHKYGLVKFISMGESSKFPKSWTYKIQILKLYLNWQNINS